MNDLEKMKRHLGRPIPIPLKNEDGVSDIFYFKPLNIEQQAILMELSKKMDSRDKLEFKGKQVPDVTKEDMEGMFELVLDVCRSSFEGADENTLNDFANNNFEQISKNLDKLVSNICKGDIDLIKKAREARKNE